MNRSANSAASKSVQSNANNQTKLEPREVNLVNILRGAAAILPDKIGRASCRERV